MTVGEKSVYEKSGKGTTSRREGLRANVFLYHSLTHTIRTAVEQQGFFFFLVTDGQQVIHMKYTLSC